MPIEDQEVTIQEMKRVLKPEGKIFLFADTSGDAYKEDAKVYKLSQDVLKQEAKGSYVSKSRWQEILKNFNDEKNYSVETIKWSQALVTKSQM